MRKDSLAKELKAEYQRYPAKNQGFTPKLYLIHFLAAIMPALKWQPTVCDYLTTTENPILQESFYEREKSKSTG